MAAPLSLAALTPKTLLLIGAPIAGIAAFMSSRKKAAAPSGVMVATPNTNDTAIGTGQLTEFENSLLAAISAISPAAEAGSSTTPTANPAPVAAAPSTPATPTPTPTVAPVVAPATAAGSYGAGFVNSYEGTGAPWAPTPAPGSITAPAGGTLLYGDFENGVLVKGTYALPNGQTVTK